MLLTIYNLSENCIEYSKNINKRQIVYILGMEKQENQVVQGKIRELSDEIINKIAAGEVIENPASAVKEMVENAIDAQAKRIRVQIEDGGKAFIRITDDGEGMSKEDLSLCYLRHTTSKLHSASDLFRLKTNGFRGEAIASIASISKMTITTRKQGNAEAYQIKINGNKPEPIQCVSAPAGTTFLVEDLFFNTPVRRNFLKSSSYEGSKILDCITRLAIAHPEIRFEYRVGERDVFLGTAEDLRGRIAEALGAGLARKMIPLDHLENGIRVKGFISPPDEALKKRTHQYLYLQNRPIWNSMIHKAIIQAYDPYAKGCPTCVLFLELPDEDFDVNVHPAKREVRFADEQKVFLAVRHAVKKALREEEVFSEERPTLQIVSPTPIENSGEPPIQDEPIKTSSIWNIPENSLQTNSPNSSFILEEKSKPNYSIPLDLFAQEEEFIPLKPKQDEPKPKEEPAIIPPAFIQIGNTYIACEDSNGLLLIHQYAAHARILYEKALRSLQNKTHLDSQELLFPELIEFSKTEILMLERSKRELNQLGFDLEPFGGNSYQLRAIPVDLSLKKAIPAIREILESLFQTVPSENDPITETLAKTWAKTNAIQTGEVLKQEEMAQLLTQLLQTEEPEISPFGKPTLMRLSLDELQKKFKN